MSLQLNVGCRTVSVPDPVQGAVIPMRLLYPTRMPQSAQRFGPYEMELALNAPPTIGRFPLLVISHGGGGTSLTHRDLACDLVRAGHAVAMIEHPGNSRIDNSLEGTAGNLENRPRHIRLAIDAALADAAVGDRLSSDLIALIGHSMGGYTALAVAGGRPAAGPHETADGSIRPVAVTRDRRVRALVLLAPACAWFWSEDALIDVDVPILLRTAERDELAHCLHIEYIAGGVRHPARVDHRVVANAGHHAFQSPFPPVMTRPDFPPSQDPPGFQRAAYQPILHAEILSFLENVF